MSLYFWDKIFFPLLIAFKLDTQYNRAHKPSISSKESIFLNKKESALKKKKKEREPLGNNPFLRKQSISF